MNITYTKTLNVPAGMYCRACEHVCLSSISCKPYCDIYHMGIEDGHDGSGHIRKCIDCLLQLPDGQKETDWDEDKRNGLRNILNALWAFANNGQTPEEQAAMMADNARLRVELENSRRRERAAISDMKDIAFSDNPCAYCAKRRGWDTCRDCDFDWRGPQEAGEEDE